MAYYRTCSDCGCTLDPCEKCDCQERAEQLRKKFELITTVSDNGQIEIGGLHGENTKYSKPVLTGESKRS